MISKILEAIVSLAVTFTQTPGGTLSPLKKQTCMSTQFGHAGDRYGGRTPTLFYDRPVSPGDMGIAHRRWPIGSYIKIRNLETDQVSFGRVIDRGPYGKVDEDGNWFNARKHYNRDGTYLGCADPHLI